MSVVPFTGDTTLPIPPERVLQGAIDAQLSQVLVLGWDKDDRLYVAMSHTDLGGLLILLEIAKADLLESAE